MALRSQGRQRDLESPTSKFLFYALKHINTHGEHSGRTAMVQLPDSLTVALRVFRDLALGVQKWKKGSPSPEHRAVATSVLEAPWYRECVSKPNLQDDVKSSKRTLSASSQPFGTPPLSTAAVDETKAKDELPRTPLDEQAAKRPKGSHRPNGGKHRCSEPPAASLLGASGKRTKIPPKPGGKRLGSQSSKAKAPPFSPESSDDTSDFDEDLSLFASDND